MFLRNNTNFTYHISLNNESNKPIKPRFNIKSGEIKKLPSGVRLDKIFLDNNAFSILKNSPSEFVIPKIKNVTKVKNPDVKIID